MFKRFAALVFTVLFIQTAVLAQSADYRRTLPVAQNGDAQAQYYIGMSHKNGWGGLQKEPRKAIKWLRLASNQGHAGAASSLGYIYYNGYGSLDDPAKALTFFRRAAEKNNPDGWYGIGLIYYNGKGVKKSLSESIKWFKLAANSNDKDFGNRANAQNILGYLHTTFFGKLDRRQAIKWYVLAAEGDVADAYFQAAEIAKELEDYKAAAKYYRAEADRGHHLAQIAIARMYWSGTGVRKSGRLAIKYFTLAISERRFYNNTIQSSNPFANVGKLTAADLTEFIAKIYYAGVGSAPDYAQAVIWYEKAAELGQSGVRMRLGKMYYDGQGVKQNYQKAKDHWTLATEEKKQSFGGGTPYVASFYLATLYLDGLLGPKDVPTAVKWLTKAASKGEINSQIRLAYIYGTGDGISSDPVQAAKWARLAALAGHIDSQVNYGVALMQGNGIPRDLPEALRFTLMAANQGDRTGQYNAGLSYDLGRGTKKNRAEAVKWFQKATDQGHVDAMADLARLYGPGQGDATDIEKAYMWASMASNANKNHRWIGAYSANLARKLSKEQITQSEKRGQEWLDAFWARQDAK
ncbi:MAG: SEL1-like repeat protein [Kordiimonadaceae bacterium]|nr:SEL1-like repeat protein [Kordiimonadaceae bacterium]